jgi:hypothetical protein
MEDEFSMVLNRFECCYVLFFSGFGNEYHPVTAEFHPKIK